MRDLAKIGQLYLDRGAWRAQRILASEWADKSWGEYNPELRRQGFMLEVVPGTGQVIICWMTFEPQTGAQHTTARTRPWISIRQSAACRARSNRSA